MCRSSATNKATRHLGISTTAAKTNCAGIKQEEIRKMSGGIRGCAQAHICLIIDHKGSRATPTCVACTWRKRRYCLQYKSISRRKILPHIVQSA